LTVHYTLGPGLLESAYEEAMCWELGHAGIRFERQKVYALWYKGDYTSSYFADLCFAASRQSSIIFTVVKIMQ
jgi:GxxExxY protein